MWHWPAGEVVDMYDNCNFLMELAVDLPMNGKITSKADTFKIKN